MLYKSILSIFLTTIIHTCMCQGQDFENYTILKSQGEIPRQFRKRSFEKYREDKRTIDINQKRSVKKAQEQFYLESNFLTDEFLLSGIVTFNDPVSNYISKVADELFKTRDSLRNAINYYTIKSTEVNAFATDNGIVLVTLGLLAQLENEAQLAYILSHETIHYLNKHSMNIFVEGKKIENGKDSYRRTSFEEKILAKSHYSKELELEADIEGLDIYLNSNYSINVLNGVFDVLQYSYLPFDEVDFERSFFETKHLGFPDKYYLEELTAISGDDDYDDSKSTHPNIRKRRKIIEKKIKGLDNSGREKFIVSKEEFLKIRDLARFELIRLYLKKLNYAKAIYCSYILLKQYPNNTYLEKSIVKALYGLTKYKNEGMLTNVNKSYKKIEGSSQQLYYFIKKIKKEDFNTLALIYSWKVMKTHPEDKTIKKLTNEIFKELVFKHNVDLEYYYKKPREELKREKEIIEGEDLSGLSKYEKIKRKKEIKEIKGDENFLKFAFVDLLKDDDFVDAFEKHMEDHDAAKEKEEMQYDNPGWKAIYKKEKKEKKLIRRKGLALGINKVVIVDPVYKKIDQRKEENIRFIASEYSQQTFISKLRKNAEIANIELQIIDSESLKASEVDVLNDFAILNEWVDELMDHQNHDMNILISNEEYIKYLIDKYNTKYYGWTGVLSIRQAKEASVYWYMFVSIFTIYMFPFGLYQAIVPDYDTYCYMVLFDIESGEIKLVQNKYFNKRDREDILNSNIYDAFHQMKTKRKRKEK